MVISSRIPRIDIMRPARTRPWKSIVEAAVRLRKDASSDAVPVR